MTLHDKRAHMMPWSFFLKVAMCCVAWLLWPQMAAAQEKTVNLYAWADYVDQGVLDDFTKETGIKVTYDTYPTNEALDAHLTADQGADDVVVISGPSLQRQIADQHLQKLDKSKLPHSKALWPDIAAYLATYDPGNNYAVNYLWFTLGLTFNAKTMQERHQEALLGSWDVIFRPEVLNKFADCGVEVQDSPNDLFAAALHYLRANPRAPSPVDLKRAADLLFALRRNVKRFRPAGDLSNLAGGDACLTLGWSGDAVQARKEAKDSDSGVSIGFATPRGGTLLLMDNLAIPKNAPHREAAYALIDYLIRPDIAARNTKTTHFANGDLASKTFLPPEILDEPSIYPDAATMKSFFTAGSYNAQNQAFMTREWTRVKTGK